MKNVLLIGGFFLLVGGALCRPLYAQSAAAGQNGAARLELAAETDVSAEAADIAEAQPGAEPVKLPVVEFRELWAYLLVGSEGDLFPEYPLTDIGYFGAEVDSYGVLTSVPDPEKLSFFEGRVHLVVTSGSRALTHFALLEGRPERARLIADLLAAVENFDGLQIDFETVGPQDGESFLNFLRELRVGLGQKMLTVALPARTRFVDTDVYEYNRIMPYVDRILVMAYDEHWSGGEPGPVASMEWCEKVAAYSLGVMGGGKLIMGVPFYGRTWGDINPNRAFFHIGIERIKSQNNVTEITREDSVPRFSYQTTLTVTGYYDDALSLSTRLDMYRKMGVRAVGFWCLGQEDPAIWPLLRLSE